MTILGIKVLFFLLFFFPVLLCHWITHNNNIFVGHVPSLDIVSFPFSWKQYHEWKQGMNTGNCFSSENRGLGCWLAWKLDKSTVYKRDTRLCTLLDVLSITRETRKEERKSCTQTTSFYVSCDFIFTVGKKGRGKSKSIRLCLWFMWLHFQSASLPSLFLQRKLLALRRLQLCSLPDIFSYGWNSSVSLPHFLESLFLQSSGSFCLSWMKYEPDTEGCYSLWSGLSFNYSKAIFRL